MNRKKKFDLLGTLSESNVSASLFAIVLGLLVGFVVIIASNPTHGGAGITSLLTGGFRNMRNFGQVLYTATPLILTGLSVAFAGKTGLFNIGASGQFIVGAYLAILVGVRVNLPGPLLCIAAVLASIIGGAIWGAVPGILKAWRNVNEVISCIMMNYIGMFLVNWSIINTIYDQTRNQTLRVQPNANFGTMGLDRIFVTDGSPSNISGTFILAIIVAVLMFIILDKTTLGYELKACGYNKDAAQYAGINSNRGVILAMVISGALAGLGGALFYLAGDNRAISVVDTLAPSGFNGIPIALLALNSPIGVIFSAIFLGYLTIGGIAMQPNFAPEVVDMIVAIIIYFSALALLIKGFFQWIKRKKRGGDTAVIEEVVPAAANADDAAPQEDGETGEDPPEEVSTTGEKEVVADE